MGRLSVRFALACSIVLFLISLSIPALAANGTVWAWGYNNSGQLGDGTWTQPPTTSPRQVPGLSGVTAIACGSSHSVALTSDSLVWVWGDNSYGQLGVGVSTAKPSPVQLSNPTDIIKIAAGHLHTLALKNGGTVWAWGDNSRGQLGDNTTTQSAVPVQVQKLTDVIAIAAGNSHSVAIKSDGTVWTWGNNDFGQLGNGTTTQSLTPVQVPIPKGAIAIAAGEDHTIALTTDHTVWAWGRNDYGQLGYTTTTNQYSPVQVQNLSGVTDIASGAFHNIALANDGKVWAWGYNSYGQLGVDATIKQSATPLPVPIQTGVIAIAAGHYHCIALANDHTVWTWGYNQYGQLGIDSTTPMSSSPIHVANLTGITAIAGGGAHTLVIQEPLPAVTITSPKDSQCVGGGAADITGTASSAGSGIQKVEIEISGVNGRFPATDTSGNGSWSTWKYSWSPPASGACTITGWATDKSGMSVSTTVSVNVDTTAPVSAITAPQSGACLSGGKISISGTAVDTGCSGVQRVEVSTDGGQTWTSAGVRDASGNNSWSTWSYNWTQPSGGSHKIQTRATDKAGNRETPGAGRTVSIVFGTVLAWGGNQYGQLGDNTTTDKKRPVKVQGLTDVAAISCGANHSMAVRSNWTVWTWGSNKYGQLGTGGTSPVNSSAPYQAPNLAGIIDVAGGGGHSVALRHDGAVLTWGWNKYGQLGRNKTIDAYSPGYVDVTGMTAVAAGEGHTVALRYDGTVWTWGRNNYGQLGDGTKTDRSIPRKVPKLSGIVAIAAGAYHTVALTSSGTVLAWGHNAYGQLGNGHQIDSPTPVKVGKLPGAFAIAGGGLHSVAAVKPTAYKTQVLDWGRNNYGQLGDGTNVDKLLPISVGGLNVVITGISGGTWHTLALMIDGVVRAWGRNNHGQLGNGNTSNSNTPVPVSRLTGIMAIAGGESHSLALMKNSPCP